MSAIFAAHTAAIFNGPLAVDAVYTPDGGEGAEVRAIPVLGDPRTSFNAGTFVRDSAVFLVATAAVANPAEGDTITVDGSDYRVQGAPERDERRLHWRIEATPQ